MAQREWLADETRVPSVGGTASCTAEEQLDLVDDLLLRAADAREDFLTFFEFVMREEITSRPVKAAPHQRVILKFVQDHDRCVLMLPVGHSKSFVLVAYTLWSLGRNPSLRGAIVSATQGQAEKMVRMVRDYIESSMELHLVFPGLSRSPRSGDHWTQTELVVARPAGIRDPSLIAFGMDGAIGGSRLNWVIVDDMLNAENTRTKEAREKVGKWIKTSVEDRMDPTMSKFVFSNTPWHPDDLVMRTIKAGWATLKMNARGLIWVRDDVERVLAWERENERRAALGEYGLDFEPWDSDELVPAVELDKPKMNPVDLAATPLVLAAHAGVPDAERTLWSDRINHVQLEAIRRRSGNAQAFNQSYMCECIPETSWCKEEWIEASKSLARELGHLGMTSAYQQAYVSAIARKLARQMGFPLDGLGGPYPCFTGLDPAFTKEDKGDDSAFFTYCALPTGHRLILDIEIGKWDVPTLVEMLIRKWRAFNSILTVENNGAQRAIRQVALRKQVTLPVKALETGRNKSHPEYGIASVFAEVENGAWLIPNDKFGQVHPHVQTWVDGLMFYQPSAHTADALMAMWFAREQARKLGMLGGGQNGADLAGLGGFNDR
jgi:hypothetical protein